MYQNNSPFPDDLAQVVAAWDTLPDAVKAEILAMVHTAQQKDERGPSVQTV